MHESSLQAMVQVVQQWLPHDRKDKYPGVFQSLRLDAPVVPIRSWSPREILESDQFSVYIRIPKECLSNRMEGWTCHQMWRQAGKIPMKP